MLVTASISELSVLFNAGEDPLGARTPGPPPLTVGFEAPKLSIFGPYLIFP